VPGHPEVELALAALYRATEEGRYLELAKFFIDQRGQQLLGTEHYGPRYRQDDVPFREAWEARGHCVRGAYLACGALDVYAETGDTPLLEAAVAQWEDMVSRRMYITGGVGSRHKDESFGDPYELPPDQAYAETCAAIGVLMWSWRLLVLTGEPRYADLMERVLFNAFAAGVSLDGASYFYVNPLQVRAGHVDPEDGRGRAARSPWYEIACCPPNVMRTLSSLGRYFVTTTPEGAQVWQYAPSRILLEVRGAPFVLSVETAYPLEGEVRVRVERAPAGPLELALRVPGWARSATGTVRKRSGEDERSDLEPGTLWRLSRQWEEGDEVVLGLPMTPHFVYPHPRIDAARGCVAVERGPLVYCLEEVDAGGPERLESLRLDTSAALGEGRQTIAGEAVPTVRARALLAATPADDVFPYSTRPRPGAPARAAVDADLVPYFAWGNRQPGETMRVWVPTV
jgi:DUF1680 family protein